MPANTLKLSQIPAASTDMTANDFLVAVQNGNTDVRFTGAEVGNFLFNGPTIISPTISGTLTHLGGFAYLGKFNSTSFPVSGQGLGLSWNQSGGSGEVDLWNVFTGFVGPVSFSFKHLTGIATYALGTIQAGKLVIGTNTSPGSQMLLELVSTAASEPEQIRVFETESATAGGVQYHGVLDVVNGAGEHSGIFSEASFSNTGAGSVNDFINNINAVVTLKYTGTNYTCGSNGALFRVTIEAGLTNPGVAVMELGTDVQSTDVSRKVGLQIVDSDTSVGFGRDYDAGILIGAVAGGRGYDYGMQFGYALGSAADEILNAFLYCPTGTIPYAFDFSGVTFSTASWKGDFSITGNQILQSAQLAANGAVATAITNVGPTGSNTTVQEWMVVKGTGGATRYIPMF